MNKIKISIILAAFCAIVSSVTVSAYLSTLFTNFNFIILLMTLLWGALTFFSFRVFIKLLKINFNIKKV